MATIAKTATRSSIAQNAASVEIKADNKGTHGYVIYNDSGADLYLGAGTAAATTTDYTWKVAAGGYLQEPAGDTLFIGPIQGIWSAAGAGAARLTVFGI